MDLQQYVVSHYDGDFSRFITGEVGSIEQQQHIQELVSIKEYLGKNKHPIKNRPNETFNGQEIKTEKVILNYAKTIIKFSVNFLLGRNPVSLSGSENVIDELNKVYKLGKYHKTDYKLLNDLIRYGEAFEFVHAKGDKIQSTVIDPAESYPVYNHENEMIAFIQYYHVDYVDYYNVFTDEIVYSLDNSGGDLQLKEQKLNLTGMPIHYKTENEVDENRGYAEINDYIDILNSMESLLSKAIDGYYRHIMGTPIVVGQTLTDVSLPKHGNGVGINLDDDGEFYYATNPFSHDSFKELYGTLRNALMDISQLPNVVLNGSTQISNVAEVAVESMYTLALIKANMNSKYLEDGFEQRLDKVRGLLAMKGISFTDEDYHTVRFVFSPSMPKSDKEIVETIVKLKEIDGISVESVLDNVSFIDKVQEMERLVKENSGKVKDANSNDSDLYSDDNNTNNDE
ncbi:phage portal protein [Halobacillus amylolyticus]|uniref:Phage portal protein n=1 Tax=Halobacillus amylolyticus TaxID=2932259 RepID=A0ABY4HBC9_9BACI|nr:phage portal protein [Halobacillus amylolyticus]UOR12188.1 phage portal protein [Halobacillus amylolyticus]